MRIRSIKPEFWRSSSISRLAIEDRLLFIGLWSYVDDNGVGVDRLSLISADLFADDVERDPSETFARVSRGLARLSEAGRIIRYTTPEGDFLSVVGWSEHQRIDKPGKQRYPLPTSGNADIRESVATPPREYPESVAPGTGEQGNRGTGEHAHAPAGADDVAAPADADAVFEQWWKHYPRKEGRAKAEKAFAKALEKTDIDTLTDAVIAYAESVATTERRFIAHATTWLNGERWDDEVDKPAPVNPYWDRAQLAADRGVPECWI